MTDRVEQADVERTNNLSHLDGAFQEAYSERLAALQIGKTGTTEEPASLDFSTKDIYLMPGDNPSERGPINGYETTVRSATTSQADLSPSNTQSDELNEGFSSRMNREDDRQPYLDAQRHQDETPDYPSNEQVKAAGAAYDSRIIRIDDPQPSMY